MISGLYEFYDGFMSARKVWWLRERGPIVSKDMRREHMWRRASFQLATATLALDTALSVARVYWPHRVRADEKALKEKVNTFIGAYADLGRAAEGDEYNKAFKVVCSIRDDDAFSQDVESLVEQIAGNYRDILRS